MNTKIVGISIAAFIGIVVLASVLMPVLDDATTVNDTFTNEGMWRMAPNTNGDVYSYDNSTKEWSLNGTVVNNANNATVSVILLDDCTIRSQGWIRGAQLTGNSVTTVVTNANDQTVISGNGLSGNGTYTIQGYGVNPDGEYLLTSYTTPVYMNGESPIYATGTTAIDSVFNAVIHITGNVKDGVTIVLNPVFKEAWTITDLVIDNVVINSEVVENHKDLYKLNGITFDVSCTATSTTDPTDVRTISDFGCSYSSYVVPYEVTAERSVHFTDNQNALFAVIPVIIIVAILLGVIALVIRSRLD